jgi:hypothetical protein
MSIEARKLTSGKTVYDVRLGDPGVAAAWLASNPGKRASTLGRDDIVVRVHLAPVLANREVG